jgi:hypothetical protein
MSDHCGTVTEDGAAVCIPGSCSCLSESKKSNTASLSLPGITKAEEPVKAISLDRDQESTLWKKIRSGVMFVIACIASPCCTPIIVPIVIALLAGTPLAMWLTANIGWVYGGLTVLSIVSLVVGVRWMGQKTETRRKASSHSTHKINAL